MPAAWLAACCQSGRALAPRLTTTARAHRPSLRSSPTAVRMPQVQLAWRVFFPEQPRSLTPKEEGKQRLRMILVADR